MDSGFPDKLLFERIARGDGEAFREIFHYYNARLYHSVLKMVKSEEEAREIIQEVFLKLWIRRGKLSEIERPGAWLFTIASNLSIDILRKQSVHK